MTQDSYAWLRSKKWQEVLGDPSQLEEEIKNFLAQENAHFQKELASCSPSNAIIFGEIKNLIPQSDPGIKLPHGQHVYYTTYPCGKDHPVFWRDDIVLVDGNVEKKTEYWHINDVFHSDNHAHIAWSYDAVGDESYTICIKDAHTLISLDQPIHGTTGDVVWDALSQGFFYIKLDSRHHPSSVFYHQLGTHPQNDQLIFHETNASYFLSISRVQSGRFIIIDSHDHDSNACFIVNAYNPTGEGYFLFPRKDGVTYTPEYWEFGEKFFILTNDNALNFKIITQSREDFIPHLDAIFIREHVVYKDFLVALCTKDANPYLLIKNLTTGKVDLYQPDDVVFPCSLELIPGYEYDKSIVYYKHSTPNIPPRVMALDCETRITQCLKIEDIPLSYFSPDSYITRRIDVPAHDGELIPLTILYKKDTPFPAPCLLYGYGAYGLCSEPLFKRDIFPLINRGFIYAIAHIRGGKEKGGKWYLDGKLFKKKNSFKDFISCGEFLCQKKYTNPQIMAAHGGSAGGMLMGAVANMRPDLFALILAEVPFVDVLSTILDASLPLTPPEWREWGNPIEDKAAYDYIRSYSPCDTIAPQRYPAIVCITSVADPRVGYWEGAKWIALLRDASTSGNPLLLKTHMNSGGHFGASGRYERYKDRSDLYAYCITTLKHPSQTKAGA